ncbi:MAG: hypothetical protein IPL28_22605 [Chloroflexi bacterium]|nr:hypothetical protein [Chloroflexota bacterium]
MFEIEIRLYASLKDKAGSGRIHVHLPGASHRGTPAGGHYYQPPHAGRWVAECHCVGQPQLRGR